MIANRENQIRGVIFGHAIGDALGLGTEFMSKATIAHHYPQGLSHYKQIIQDTHRARFEKGDWTDDTDQMLCIFDSLLALKRFDTLDIARRIYQWGADGAPDIGQTVHSVLTAPGFLENPHKVSQSYWESTGKNMAANGGVMRTSIIGVWEYHDLEKVAFHAQEACKITHHDPRCILSCQIISLLIARLLQGESDIPALLNELKESYASKDPRVLEYFNKALDKNIAPLELGESLSMGYTLKAMSAGIWALQNATSFKEGLLAIIHEGGDADTNAAVAGPLLGARFGYSSIPSEWIDGLKEKDALEERVGVLRQDL
jgi:ADP-ribosylglycohydrolase